MDGTGIETLVRRFHESCFTEYIMSSTRLIAYCLRLVASRRKSTANFC